MLWTCLDIQHIRRSPLVAICRADFGFSLHDFAVELRVRPFKLALQVVELRVRPFKSSVDLICLLGDCSYIGLWSDEKAEA